MQPTPHEVWATYSVKDHCEPRAFIADVMLYDRLVLPVPSNEEVEGKPEWVRWEEADWQPYQQQKLIKMLAACRREGKPPFFLPPGPRGWHTKPSCAPPGGRNGADNQCSAPYFCSLRQTARGPLS